MVECPGQAFLGSSADYRQVTAGLKEGTRAERFVFAYGKGNSGAWLTVIL